MDHQLAFGFELEELILVVLLGHPVLAVELAILRLQGNSTTLVQNRQRTHGELSFLVVDDRFVIVDVIAMLFQ